MSNFNKLFQSIMQECLKSQQSCKACHGTGYIKSHSDQPDSPCPYCRDTTLADIQANAQTDELKNSDEVTDAQIDAIIAQNQIKRNGLTDLYSESFTDKFNKVIKESSVVLPDEVVKCQICGKDITKKVVWDKHYGNQYSSEQQDFYCEDPRFTHNHICLDCAEAQSKRQQENNTNADATVLEFINNDSGETWVSCADCGTLWPERELRDTDTGMVCDDCINGYSSRGEEFSINYNRH